MYWHKLHNPAKMRTFEGTPEAIFLTACMLTLSLHSSVTAVGKDVFKSKYQLVSASFPQSGRTVVVDPVNAIDRTNTTLVLSTLTTLPQPGVPLKLTTPTASSASTYTLTTTSLAERAIKDGVSRVNTTLPYAMSTNPQSTVTLSSTGRVNLKSTYTLSTMPFFEVSLSVNTIDSTPPYKSSTLPKNSGTTTSVPRTSQSQADVPNYDATPAQPSDENSSLDSKGRQLKPTAIPYGYSTTVRPPSLPLYVPVNQRVNSNMGYTSSSRPSVYQSTSDAIPSTPSTTKASAQKSTASTLHADAVVFLNRKTTTGAPTSSVAGKVQQRVSTLSTTLANVLWNGMNRTTSTTPFTPSTSTSHVPNNVNATTEQNLIDFKEIITAPEFKCPDDQKRDMDGKCKDVY